MSLAERLNQYRVMWIMLFFDLPTETKKDKKHYRNFSKALEKDGFTRFQYSVYIRHCPSPQNAAVHIRRVQAFLPPNGHISMFTITDKQFGSMANFQGKKKEKMPNTPQQLELF